MTPFAVLLIIVAFLCFGLGYSTANRLHDRKSKFKRKCQEEYRDNVISYSRRQRY